MGGSDPGTQAANDDRSTRCPVRRSPFGREFGGQLIIVCSSFYEGPAGADDPVARRRPVGAPGPTNNANAGGKGLLCQRPGRWRPGVSAARNRAAAGSRSPAHGTIPGPGPAPAHPRHRPIPGTGTGSIPGTAVAVPVAVLVLVGAWALTGVHARDLRRERGRRGPRSTGSFYEGPAVEDEPVARRRPVGAPGPTNKPNAGKKGFCISARVDGARGLGRRRGRGPG
jgi:hypothetical protein